MNNDYSKVGLYPHNIESYKKVKEAYNSGERFIAIVHGTGTGKSYNALQLIYDIEQDSKIEILDIDEEPTELNDGKMIYVVPSNAIIEHLDETIEKNPNLDRERDFPNLEFWTYQKLITLSREEIKKLNIKLLIIDEFHHIGAPVWGSRTEEIIKTHPKMKVFGMTAYTIRDRGTPYERDMVNPDTNEIFSNKVVSRYDIVDAMIDGVLPKPIYKSAKTKLYEFASQLEEKVSTCKASNEDKENYQKILKDVKARITEAPTTKELIQKNVKPNSKCIYFCPPGSVKGVNDIETIKQELLSWFKEYIPEEDIIIYTTTSEMGTEGKKNRDAFYNDLTLDGENAEGKLRVMLAINQYNEGVHSKNVDTVILGRSTQSDIVYFEQIGRANSVKGNTSKQFDEYEKYSLDELKNICKEREISISDNASKIDIIERIIAPTIIDLTDNYEFIKQLENNLKDRVKEYQKQGTIHEKRIRTLEDTSFDIEVLNQDLFEMLKYVRDRLTLTWEDKYELAKAYYNHYGNLEIHQSFKTINGIDYDENGLNLGTWISTQREKQNNLTEPRRKLLEEIGMRFEKNYSDIEWNKKYELAKAYYNHYENLEIPQSFKTINGIDYDENGLNLGIWISHQRQNKKKLSEERIKLLEEIGMRLKTKDNDDEWNKKYELAKAYYNHYGNLETPQRFKTINGIDYDENGSALGTWINNQRTIKEKSSKEKIKLLEEIGMRFETRNNDDEWNKKYELAKAYYNHYGNLEIPQSFKTINGIDYDENGSALGGWINNQKTHKGKLTEEKINMLNDIGMIWYSKTRKFQQQEITPENTNFVKAQLLTEFKQFLEAQKDAINSEEDIENINNQFNKYVGRRK